MSGRRPRHAVCGLKAEAVISGGGMSGTWVVQRYSDPQGWRIVYCGTAVMARRTYWALGERLRGGYLRLINPRGAIVEAILRPTPAERADAQSPSETETWP